MATYTITGFVLDDDNLNFKDTTYSNATADEAGLMSSTDKGKLDMLVWCKVLASPYAVYDTTLAKREVDANLPQGANVIGVCGSIRTVDTVNIGYYKPVLHSMQYNSTTGKVEFLTSGSVAGAFYTQLFVFYTLS